MKIIEYRNGVKFSEIQHFSLSHTFDCGQCFRFEKQLDDSYTGVAFGKVINICSMDDGYYIDNTNLEDFENIWAKFFDLNRDYGAIKAGLCKDAIIKTAVEHGFGIRIIKQEFWETLVSFIISQRNSIPKIKKVVGLLCQKFGDEIIYNGEKYYSFPTAKRLSKLSLDDLAFLRCGYRDKYILDAANKIISGDIDIDSLQNAYLKIAKQELKKINGVGDKVALCVLLFSVGRYDAFPVDTWIIKAMQRYNIEEKGIEEYSCEYFGENCGFAQQYLFYCEREKGF